MKISKNMRIVFSLIMMTFAVILNQFISGNIYLNALLIIIWLISGYDIVIQAFKNLMSSRILAEHFLMAVATIGALLIGEYLEAAMVMVLFQLGELLEDRAVNKSRESIADLMDIQAPIAYKLEGEKRIEVDPNDLEIGDLIEVKPGEKVPVDGTVLRGESSIDTSALTGESIPVEKFPGDQVLSGSINGNGRIIIRADKEYSESTASKIIELLEEATENQAKTETIINKFARVYTPIVVVLAIILAFVPPLLIKGAIFDDWLKRGLIFLVVSCPCAFVISVPMAFVTGLGVSSKMGILVKGGSIFEELNRVETLAFDKTGTLTEGKFSVQHDHQYEGFERNKMLAIGHSLEEGSNHPIALAIRKYAKDNLAGDFKLDFEKIENIPGRGVKSEGVDGSYIIGNLLYMKENDLFNQAVEDGCTSEIASIVHLAQLKPEKKYLGHFVINDRVKAESKSTLDSLNKLGLKKIVMLTGDADNVAGDVAFKVGIKDYHAGLMPQDKLEWVRNHARTKGHKIAFVGDGLNDAPVIAASNVGLAMGGIGSDASIEAADIVLINDDLRSVPRAFKISRETVKIAKENIWFSLLTKLVFLVFSAFGMTPMWLAVFADVGVTLLAITNSFRIYLLPKKLK